MKWSKHLTSCTYIHMTGQPTWWHTHTAYNHMYYIGSLLIPKLGGSSGFSSRLLHKKQHLMLDCMQFLIRFQDIAYMTFFNPFSHKKSISCWHQHENKIQTEHKICPNHMLTPLSKPTPLPFQIGVNWIRTILIPLTQCEELRDPPQEWLS